MRQKNNMLLLLFELFLSLMVTLSYLFKYLTKLNLLSGGKLTRGNSLRGLFRPEHFVNSGILKSTPFDLNCLKRKSILCTDELLAAEVLLKSLVLTLIVSELTVPLGLMFSKNSRPGLHPMSQSIWALEDT